MKTANHHSNTRERVTVPVSSGYESPTSRAKRRAQMRAIARQHRREDIEARKAAGRVTTRF